MVRATLKFTQASQIHINWKRWQSRTRMTTRMALTTTIVIPVSSPPCSKEHCTRSESPSIHNETGNNYSHLLAAV